MPQSFLNQINQSMLQLLAIFVCGAILVALVGRASRRFIASFPDDTPEKPELLRASTSPWVLWPPLAALACFYALLVWAHTPILAFVVMVLVLLTPLVLLMVRGRNEYLDAPFAAVEVMAARLTHRPPDPQRWLVQHRRQVERRRKLAVLPFVMLALMVALALLGVFAYATIDRVLAVRLHSMAVAEQVQTQMGTSAGTIFSQSPPCVKQPTLMVVPPPNVTAAQVSKLKAQATNLVRQLDPKQQWAVKVITGTP